MGSYLTSVSLSFDSIYIYILFFLLLGFKNNSPVSCCRQSDIYSATHLFISLSHSFVPRVSAAEAGYAGPMGPPYGPHTPQSHRHDCCPTQRDGFPASSDKTLCHHPAHHTVSV